MDIPKVVQSYFNPRDRWNKAENKAQCFLVIVQVASYFFIIIPLFVATVGLGAWSFSKIFNDKQVSSSSGIEENAKPKIHSDPQIARREAEENLDAALKALHSKDPSSITSDILFKFKSICFFYESFDCQDDVAIQGIQIILETFTRCIIAGETIPKKEDQVRWLLTILDVYTHQDFSNSIHNILTEIAKVLPPLADSSSEEDIHLYISLIKILSQYSFSGFHYMNFPSTFEVIEGMIQKIDLGENKNKALCQTLNNDLFTLNTNMQNHAARAEERV